MSKKYTHVYSLNEVLRIDFEDYHEADGVITWTETSNERNYLIDIRGDNGGGIAFGGYNETKTENKQFNNIDTNYAMNLPHPIKSQTLYSASATALLRDSRSEEERIAKREKISSIINSHPSQNLAEHIATLARSGPAASDLQTIIQIKGIQNIDFKASVNLPYVESYYVDIPDGVDIDGNPQTKSERRCRKSSQVYSIMDIAAIENNTVFIDTIMSEYLKAVYRNELSPEDMDRIENALCEFFNKSSEHRQVVGNTLYGAIRRVKQDFAADENFQEYHFNQASKQRASSITEKLHEHVFTHRFRRSTALILSFTVCLLLPLISHAIVWGVYFYQRAKMDFKETTISWDTYLQYLNRKEGRNFSTFADVQQHLDQKEAAKPTKMHKHFCSRKKEPCSKPSHRFTIPKHVEYLDEVNQTPTKVKIRTSTWNGQSEKFRRALKGLKPQVVEQTDNYQENVQPSAPAYCDFFNAPPPPYNPASNGDGSVTYPLLYGFDDDPYGIPPTALEGY